MILNFLPERRMLMENYQMNCNIQLLITILDYSLSSSAEELYKECGSCFHYFTHGHGAAKPEIYDILGFGEAKKSVLMSILSEHSARSIMNKLQSDFHLDKPGKGISFTLPINGAGNIIYKFCSGADENSSIEGEETMMSQNQAYDLILTIVNNGFFNEVMEAAKAAGAKGGTLLHARGLASEETAKFLGITIQPEKDVLLILASHENKHAIMESIRKTAGLTTDGRGVCISLPVNEAIGIRMD